MTIRVRQARAAPALLGVPRPAETGGCQGRDSPFAVIACRLLRAAAERTAAAWRDELGAAASESAIPDVVVGLARAVQEQRSGGGARSLAVAATPLGRHVLDRLRAAVLAETPATEPAACTDVVLATVRAIEQIRAAIAPQRGDAAASLQSAPDSLELLVQVAHDLRSPLTSILFLAETLQRGQSGEINELQHRQLGLIYSAALGLSSLASDVLELARGGDGLVEREPEPLSVNQIFHSVRDIVGPLAAEKRVAIRLLPPSIDHRLGHPMALSRVLLNLTTNALKFTAEGFVELVAQEKGPSRVAFSVRDTGRGINPAILDSLYAPLRHAPARGGFVFSGTGLGLTICRRLVEAMGARLHVESRPEWGTRFFFELALPPATPPR